MNVIRVIIVTLLLQRKDRSCQGARVLNGEDTSLLSTSTSPQVTTQAPSSASNSTNTGLDCHETTFLVPVTLFAPGEYPVKSSLAHAVLGGDIICIVVTWFLHVGQFPTPLRHLPNAYMVSGVLQMILGAYLLMWCFVLLQPSEIEQLWAYSTRDLLQIQHIAISLCALCCGAIEVGIGKYKLYHEQWHVLWCLNMCCIGMIFMVHPQADFSGSSTHTMLGFFIVFGSIFFLAEKWKGFPEDLYESWNIVIAGGLYLFAASQLLQFKEHHKGGHGGVPGQHRGYNLRCHHGTPVTLTCLVVACVSISFLLFFFCVTQAFLQKIDACMHALHEDPMGVLWRCECDRFEHMDDTNRDEEEDDNIMAENGEKVTLNGERDHLVTGRTTSGQVRSPAKSKRYGKGRYSRVEMGEHTKLHKNGEEMIV